MQIYTPPRRIFKYHIAFIAVLFLANAIAVCIKLFTDYNFALGFIRMFDFNHERNIPTFFSATAIFICAVLLLNISLLNKKRKQPFLGWLGLAVIFFFLTLDEILSLHEHLIKPIRATFKTQGAFYYGWIIPYGIVLVLLVCAYAKFLISLPKRTSKTFLLAGFIFTLGAIGLEMIGGIEASANGVDSLYYHVVYTFEELLEMIGMALFLYGLLDYCLQQLQSISLKIE